MLDQRSREAFDADAMRSSNPSTEGSYNNGVHYGYGIAAKIVRQYLVPQWQDVPTEDCWAWLEELPENVGPVEVRLATIRTVAGDDREVWCWYDRNIQVLGWIEITGRVWPLAARPRAEQKTVDEPKPIGKTTPQ